MKKIIISMMLEFKQFVARGNVVDMAVGVIIGGAFGKVVGSLVSDVFMPPLGLLTGGVDFADKKIVLKAAEGAQPAVALGYGLFINALITFVIVAFAVFLLVKAVNILKREAPPATATPTTADCPQCLMPIPVAAKKCGHCASLLV